MSGMWADVWAERNELADMLESASYDDWNAPSLCARWRVRDVVGHIVLSADSHAFGRVLLDLAKYRFDMNRMLADAAIETGQQHPADLLKRLREASISEYTPPFARASEMLSDTVVHVQDIRRPLDLPRTIPERRVRAALATMATNRHMGNKKRIGGLLLVATDMEWVHGSGPEIRGTGEALLMAMCGRPVDEGELEGGGLALLQDRSHEKGRQWTTYGQ
jgi:uncharacterized protein (TIGR03083 family)